jgi:hypothetical protein
MLGLLITMERIQRYGVESHKSENLPEKIKVHPEIPHSRIVAA